MSNDEVEEMSIDHKPDDPIERNRVEKAGNLLRYSNFRRIHY
jgi:hypothetical protein